MKRFLVIITALCLVISLSGCAKLLSTEYQNVEVEIKDKYYRASYTTPMRVGKITTIQRHSAVYRITVEYNGTEYVIRGKDTYNKFKDKIGQSAIGTLEIRTYDDDTVKYIITQLN